jgi:hypothetical protein
MALEVDEMGDPVARAVASLVQEGHLRFVVSTLHEADAPNVSDALWDQLGGGAELEEVLQAEPIDAEVLDMILIRAGPGAIEPMLDALAESESQQTRRVLIDRIVRLGPQVGPAVLRRMEDTRWFVQRNMLGILARLPEVPEEYDAAAMLHHEDPRVRRPAVEVALHVDTARERAICAALADSDDRIVRIALNAAAESCPESALPLVVQRAASGPTEDQRLSAVRVLAGSERKTAVEALMRMAEPRRTLLGWKLPHKNKVLLAALKALRGKGSDPKVRRVLDVAARSRDPEVAAAATGGEEEGDKVDASG